MSPRLQDKRCLIVGGTSGLGLAAARRFLEEGARLVIAGLADDHLEAAGAALRPIACWPCVANQAEAVERLIANTVLVLGGLDVLYHVAGGSGRRFGDGPLHECTDDGWRATLDTNLTSVFLTNRAAIRQFLVQEHGGVILNMGSVLALSPAPKYFDTAAYAAAKGGIIALSRQAAARYAADGIRINVLAPSLIGTPMAARAVGDADVQAYLENKQPLWQGPGRPEDCADAAVFLCSDAARHITGVVLPVDGGWCVSEGR